MEREATRDYLSRLMALYTPVFTRVTQHLDKVGTREKNDTEFLCWFFQHVERYANEKRVPEILNRLQAALSDQDLCVCVNAALSPRKSLQLTPERRTSLKS